MISLYLLTQLHQDIDRLAAVGTPINSTSSGDKDKRDQIFTLYMDIDTKKRASSDDLDDSSKKAKSKKESTHYREYNTVLVRNLPPNYNHFKVRKYFKTCGSVLQADVVDDKDGSSKLARVEFSSYDEVLTAMTRTLKKIGHYQITVEHLTDSTLWITNYPPGYDASKLRSMLSDHVESPILSIRLPSLAFNSRRRFAYVDLTSRTAAERAIEELNGKEVAGYKLIVKLSNINDRKKRTDDAISEGRELIVKGISEEVSDEALLGLFSKYGDIEKHRMVKADEGSTRYAFITYRDEESAERALALNGETLEDKTLHVSKAMKKAYLERQEVKRLLASKRNDPKIIGLYPLSDQVTREEITALIIDKSSVQSSDIAKVLLVSDHEGALVVMKEEKCAAKVSLALNGFKFKNRMLNCVSTFELSKHFPNERGHSVQVSKGPSHGKLVGETHSNNARNNTGPEQEHLPQQEKKMSNDDFRKMFLSK